MLQMSREDSQPERGGGRAEERPSRRHRPVHRLRHPEVSYDLRQGMTLTAWDVRAISEDGMRMVPGSLLDRCCGPFPCLPMVERIAFPCVLRPQGSRAVLAGAPGCRGRLPCLAIPGRMVRVMRAQRAGGLAHDCACVGRVALFVGLQH